MTEWIAFAGVFAALIVVDLRGASERPSLAMASLKTAFNAGVAACFAMFVMIQRDAHTAMEFVTGYVLEMSLSFDNVFVISLIMTAMVVPQNLRARMLLWGIGGAILLRGIFIGSGSLIVSEFRWVLLGFAIFLIWTGGKMIFAGDSDEEMDVEKSRTMRFLRGWVRITPSYHGSKFFVRSGDMPGRWYATPFLAAMIMVEVADLMFAVDSIPAIFAITTDPFVVFTSNMFAVASLRSLFFVLEAMVHRFSKLQVALSAVLIFIGAKVIYAEMFGGHVPIPYALGGVLGILLAGIIWSVIATRGQHAEDKA